MSILQKWSGYITRFLFDKFRVAELQRVRGINRPISFLAKHWPPTNTTIVGLTRSNAKATIAPSEGYVFWSGYYEPAESLLIDHLLKPGDIAVDIGANVGLHMVRMASLVGPSGRVYCFEPNPKCFRRLENNVSLNGFTNVHCFPVALASHSGSTTLFVNADGGNATLVKDPENKSTDDAQVKVSTLNEVLAGKRVHFIKVDIEGYELDALRGGEDIIKKYQPLMMCEYSEYYARLLRYEWRRVTDYFKSRGYRIYSINGCLLDEAFTPNARSNFNYVALPNVKLAVMPRFLGSNWRKTTPASPSRSCRRGIRTSI